MACLQRAVFRRSLGILLAMLVALGAVVEPAWPGQLQSATVYITRTGARYHRDGCSSLRRSRIPISLQEAIKRGYTPCRICRPTGGVLLPAQTPRRYRQDHQRQNFLTVHCGNCQLLFTHRLEVP
ncbi:MAG: hypothetical protein KatS3mg039_1655 [Candidatus Kapaibacterium sp.]|nr:MAG: hypothetical protein KatS3mg039_1655 [Candidatus Kapabacteria bacterium]